MRKLFLVLVSVLFFSCVPKGALDFDEVDKVRLISYPSRTYWGMNQEIINSNGELNIQKEYIIDDLFLSKENKSKLFPILENNEWFKSIAACYEPRHLFIFYDSKNRIIGNYEVCLECGGNERTKNLDYLPDFSIKKGAELKDFFIELDLKNIGSNSKIVKQKESVLLDKLLNEK